MTGRSRAVRIGAWVAGGLGALLGLFLVVGLFLPRTWDVEAAIEVAVPPDSVWTYVGNLDRWAEWNPWPPGAEIGEGRVTWDDRTYGEGEFVVERVEGGSGGEGRTLLYHVSVEGGALRVRGELHVESAGEGRTRLEWSESGEFGRNPLLGWTALGMGDDQAALLEERLLTLRELAELP